MMKPDRNREALDAMRQALQAELPSGGWALGGYVEDMPCLVLSENQWLGGFFEHGTFTVRFRTESFDDALALFTTWVRSVEESTRLSAEATARWLARKGKKRP